MKSLVYFLLLTLTSSASAQNFKFNEKTQKYDIKKAGSYKTSRLSVDDIINELNGGIKIKSGNKWGLIKYNGEVIVEPKYENITSQSNELHIVKVDGKYGVIDLQENFVLEPKYDQIDYSNVDQSYVKINGKWCLKKGETYIEVGKPTIYRNPQVKPTLKECIDQEPNCVQKKLLKKVYGNLRYPDLARIKRIQGITISEVIISENGKIEQVRVIEGLGHGIDEVVHQTLSNNDLEWIPAKDHGENVKYKFYMPIIFRLEGNL